MEDEFSQKLGGRVGKLARGQVNSLPLNPPAHSNQCDLKLFDPCPRTELKCGDQCAYLPCLPIERQIYL